MAKVTLEYDGRNVIAKKALDFILSLGVFKAEEDHYPNAETIEAINELKAGKGKSYSSFDEMIKDAMK